MVIPIILACLSNIAPPSVECELSFCSKKIERGMCENPDPVFSVSTKASLCGAYVGIEAIYDITDRNDRHGRYNEIMPYAGYAYQVNDSLIIGSEYHFKQGVDEHTQEIEAHIECPFYLLTPFVSFNVDCDRVAGSLYSIVGVEHRHDVYAWLAIVADVGCGFGNARRNAEDFDRNAIGARDIHIGVLCECALCEHIKLCPYCRAYQQLTHAAQREYNGGFFVDAGCSLAVNF